MKPFLNILFVKLQIMIIPNLYIVLTDLQLLTHSLLPPPLPFRIIDQSTSTEIASFPIYNILFCVRGQNGTSESDCFAFTESFSGPDEFHIHVFCCEIKEAVSTKHFLKN